MGIILAVITAVCWGSIVLVSQKLGGDSYSQTLGMTIGALVFSVITFFIVQPDMNSLVIIVGAISGALWVVGQRFQFATVDHLGVAKTVPLSTGMQLFGTTLFGVLVFHEWKTKTEIIIGIIAIVVIILGAVFTSIRDKNNKEDGGTNYKRGYLILLLSTAGYVGYVVIVNWFKVGGWEAILPQAAGMFIGGLLLTFTGKPFNKFAVRNILTGILWSTGNITLLLSLPKIGVATSFSLSQTGIIISTLGGIFILKEKKSKRQIIFVIAGCLLIIAGGVMLGITKR
ncbi:MULTISPECIES: GRP family sugar transporter [unclassified Fictibacillus]|uniref:GRP family sugar transporter n=1 Tax=unclassified Fictibacillus TaxID=2644029 RepID=UPI0006A797EE|nr:MULTISPECIES: GRP family sugar transporter [unclassified Fictibacillus]MED2971533.1 GRP family sugar transporter [Fictibacillus sp. B-59209]UZJ81051.1 GRP family sugar transporter [Fictibacillus sp. KU28468]